MRLPKIVLAGTAALVLSVSLGACSFSVNGSGSGDSASSAATQAEQKDQSRTTSADSSGSAKTDSKDSAKSGPQSSSNGSAKASADSDDKDDDKDGDDAPITDAAWKDIQSKGQRTEVSGSYSVQDAGSTLNLVGDLDTLTVQGAETKIAADDIDHLNIMGSDVTVHWLGDDPVIQDMGVGSTTGKLTQ